MKRNSTILSRVIFKMLIIQILAITFFTEAKRYDLPQNYPASFTSWNDSVDSIIFRSKVYPSKYNKLVILPISRSRLKFDRNKGAGNETNVIINQYLNQITQQYIAALLPLNEKLEIPLAYGNLNSINGQTLVLKTDILFVDPGLEGVNKGNAILKMETRLIDGGNYLKLTKFSHTTTKEIGTDANKALASCMNELAGQRFGSVIYSLLSE